MGSKFKKKGQSQIMKKSTSTLIIAMLILGIAGCSEGGEINPTDSGKTAEVTTTADSVKEKSIESVKEIATKTPIETVKTIETEKNLIDPESELDPNVLNLGLLEELGMTFGELEKKYGKAEKGKVGELNESNNHGFYTYSFKGSNIDYSFYAESDGQKTISDGTPRIKEEERFIRFEGAAKEFFLNFEKSMTYEEFSKIYGTFFPPPPDDWEWDDWGSGLRINKKTLVWNDYDYKEYGIIKPDSTITITYELD